MLQPKENRVKIEGILSEVDLRPTTFTKDGRTHDAITGSIKVRVEQRINKTDENLSVLEIPVYMFSSALKNDGTPNPAYENITKIMNEYTSIAASDINSADRIRITGASIRMNEYYGQNGNLVSFPRINASFVSKVRKEDFKPEATFSATFVVGSKGYIVDADGVETDKYKVTGILPQFGGKVDVVEFFPASKNVIESINSYWEEGNTVRASGRLNFTSRTETVLTEVDFGDPIENTRTISVSELVITGGSSVPLEGDAAYDEDEISMALKERKERLAKLKEDSKNKSGAKKAPPAKKAGFKDLGF